MSSEISAEQSYAYAELLEILSFLNKKFIEKIPSKMMNIFNQNALTTYENHLDISIPIHEQSISKKTAALIAVIALKYWCESDEEISILKEVIAENDKKFEAAQKEQFNPDNIFDKPKVEKIDQVETITHEEPLEENNTQLLDYSSLPWYKKIFIPLKKLTSKIFKKTNNPT